MSASDTHGFWTMNHVVNPVLRPILRGPLGRLLGRHLAVLRYIGNRTGKTHQVVVQYVRAGDDVWIMPGQPDHKVWWRNLRAAAPVEIWLAGERRQGLARAMNRSDQSDEFAQGLTTYRTHFPRARFSGTSTIMIRVELKRQHTDVS